MSDGQFHVEPGRLFPCSLPYGHDGPCQPSPPRPSPTRRPVAMPDDEGLREEIRAVLGPNTPYPDSLTRSLLPVVERYAARRAAEALREAAGELDDLYETGGAFGAENLTAAVRLNRRADALDGEP